MLKFKSMLYRKIEVAENFNNQSDNQDILDRLLFLRGIKNEIQKEKFLNPTMADFISPDAFTDLQKALDRIKKAIDENQKILIWGDFDCDGVTSSAILYKTLKELNANIEVFIPDRLLHGHGLNSKELIKFISKDKVKLVITVDCGISNISEINLLKSLKIDTIITDHHTTDLEAPEAYAIINPNVKGSIKEDLSVEDITSLTYNCGAIVAYKLSRALLKDNTNENLKDEILTIASCGAIADVVPLLGENRAIVSEGLKLLNQKKDKTNKGIYKLLSKNIQDRDFTSYDIGFILAPRINAVGRLNSAKLAFDFLTTDNDLELDVIIQKLDNFNAIRQSICKEISDEIELYIKNHKEEQENEAIILINKDWHIGAIGITASGVVEKYQKPCFLMTIDENNFARCSIRSNEKINVYQVLKENQELFEGFGGHKLAGGCSFDLSKISFEEVKKALLKTIKETSPSTEQDNTLKADIELNTEDLNEDLIKTINKLEPFGQNNEIPLCAMFGVEFKDFKLIGKEKNHLKMNFLKNGINLDCIKWKEDNFLIPKDTVCDIAFYPKLNTFNDKTSIQLEIVDVFSDCIKQQQENRIKIFDHRLKTGILDTVNDYLKKVPDIVVYAKTVATKEKLSNFQNIKDKFIKDNSKKNALMFFDYPTGVEEFAQVISDIKPQKIHFMNTQIDENLENYIKQINGMIKYCSNKLNGEIDLERLSCALGMSVQFVQIALEIMENLSTIEIIKENKIKYLKPFNYEEFKNNSMFEILKEEFEEIISYKKNLLNCDIEEIEQIILQN